MNLTKPFHTAYRILHYLALNLRQRLPRRQSATFRSETPERSGISQIYVINLDGQPRRWAEIQREFACVLDAEGNDLGTRTTRYSAVDAQSVSQDLPDGEAVYPFYTLGDQLYVEPQPQALPDGFDLTRPICMSSAEVAIARSHIGVWRSIAQSSANYALIVEDDVWLERGLAHAIDQAWDEMTKADGGDPKFDVLYLSYAEARHGAPKELISANLFRPERGLWYLSGYVLSKKGAQKLLNLLPCRGPIDLWINQQFQEIDVRALRRPVIHQRADLVSTNSYSILPALTKIGVLDYGSTALFHQRPTCFPVFAFGRPGTGLSSVAMALSMLGYRCCSDLDRLPETELKALLAGKRGNFDAYVNVGSLEPHVDQLVQRFPQAKFIVTEHGEIDDPASDQLLINLLGADVVCLKGDETFRWRALCEHLRTPPPVASYPRVEEIGQRKYLGTAEAATPNPRIRQLRHDRSPWVAEPNAIWRGIRTISFEGPTRGSRIVFDDDLSEVQPSRWLLRNDTFPGNLGLFRHSNVSACAEGGLSLAVREEALGVRNFAAAAISSCGSFLYGRFEAILQATNVPGVITGFFLYRASPRQEIDIEIAGNCPTQLLVNVFYNPGSEGAKFDYGYRGTPVAIPLGFDASRAPHRFAIEWDPCEIRWLVDGTLVHRRGVWNPTPIPDLPMVLHVNTWPARSRELAGRLASNKLPAATNLRGISIDAFDVSTNVGG
ncbi:family 16 glycosylhydrolase [Bradyrhizobium zhanjiangense]|uniref:Glycosyl hydrolase family protein n=1 Tax=Bradyrhizobium zhanjiangense TaxID=1325107 RepID=A0A4Q0QM27_9BRAD|nr:family 16 glycosylhydrolase [Bradyrhizobium zhanjiangense]RXG95800.1 glycosyl hydrolase family protein [Bradyrhizobium zhanjiangense]